jgi:hypothetical protein
MFVRKAKYEAALKKIEEFERDKAWQVNKFNRLVREFNSLAMWIKVRGGTAVIDQQMAKACNVTFTPDEIKSMIRLCHPDKHNGSTVANVITTKLLQMRK